MASFSTMQSPFNVKKCRPIPASEFLLPTHVPHGISALTYSKYGHRNSSRIKSLMNENGKDREEEDSLKTLQDTFGVPDALRLFTRLGRDGTAHLNSLIRRIVYEKDKMIDSLSAKLEVEENHHPTTKRIKMLEAEVATLQEYLEYFKKQYQEEITALKDEKSKLENSAEWQAIYTADISAQLHAGDQVLKMEQQSRLLLARELDESRYRERKLEEELLQTKSTLEMQAAEFLSERQELLLAVQQASEMASTQQRRKSTIGSSQNDSEAGHRRSSAFFSSVELNRMPTTATSRRTSVSNSAPDINRISNSSTTRRASELTPHTDFEFSKTRKAPKKQSAPLHRTSPLNSLFEGIVPENIGTDKDQSVVKSTTKNDDSCSVFIETQHMTDFLNSQGKKGSPNCEVFVEAKLTFGADLLQWKKYITVVFVGSHTSGKSFIGRKVASYLDCEVNEELWSIFQNNSKFQSSDRISLEGRRSTSPNDASWDISIFEAECLRDSESRSYRSHRVVESWHIGNLARTLFRLHNKVSKEFITQEEYSALRETWVSNVECALEEEISERIVLLVHLKITTETMVRRKTCVVPDFTSENELEKAAALMKHPVEDLEGLISESWFQSLKIPVLTIENNDSNEDFIISKVLEFVMSEAVQHGATQYNLSNSS